jgi:beta-lactam-binding protein with PASTA domain
LPAVTPEAPTRAAAPDAPAAPAAAAPGTGVVPAAPVAPAAPAPPAASSVPAAPPPPAQPPAPAQAAANVPASASITLRTPEGEVDPSGGPVAIGVEPGGHALLLALIRNQSGIVDNYDLEIRGMPREWWTIAPETVYLVPFGSPGSYEQQVNVQFHPPRSPEAEARIWDLQVIVRSRAMGAEVAAAPCLLGIQPYEQVDVKVRPDRRSGRRRVRYDVHVRNQANAVATVALVARDDEAACRTRFSANVIDLLPGEDTRSQLEVRPPRQLWIGRPVDRRLQVLAGSGEEGQRLLAEAADAPGGGRLGAAQDALGQFGVKTPQLQGPKLSVGPDGVSLREPKMGAAHVQQARAQQIDLASLRGRGGAGMVKPPLLPNQLTFRQKPWLPWWLAIVVPLLVVAIVALLSSQTKQVTVPDLTRAATVFQAQDTLQKAGLKLDPATQPQATTKAKPGAIVAQTPKAGAKVDEGTPVTLQVATGTGLVKVPSIVGSNLADADKTLRAAKLAVGPSSLQPPDPAAIIKSQIPSPGEAVKEGTPISIFYGTAKAGAAAGAGAAAAGAGAAAGSGGKDDKGGGGKGAAKGPVAIPPVAKDPKVYGAALAAAGVVPVAVSQFNEAKAGEVFATDPAAGTSVAAGATVRMLVSAGFPRLVYDNDKDVLLANGANGARLPAIAKTDAQEKDPTWSADAKHVVYTANGRLMLADVTQAGAPPTPLTDATTVYADPSFAPDPNAQTLAVAKVNSPTDRNDTDLCVGKVTADGFQPQCIEDTRFGVGNAQWSADGKTMLVPATGPNGFGIVRYRSQVPYSPRASDWGKGTFVTPRDPDGETGVIAEALSPDGKHLAAVANLDTPEFRLYLAEPGDLRLEKAKPLPLQACKVAWRADSQELVIVQEGPDCSQGTGQLLRVSVDKPTEAEALSANGDNPAFQPLVLGK